MRRTQPWIAGLGGLALATFTRGWMRTLRYQVAYYDPAVDPTHRDHKGPLIYLFWHEYILMPFYLRGHCDIAMLLSQHQDAEFLSRAARQMGYHTVRGSSTRGGTAALRKLLRKARSSLNLAITPDGPQGPRRELAPGCIYLSSRLRMPLVMMGFGYERPWRYRRAWDQFALPRPGSRACAVIGPPLQIPADLDRDGIEAHRARVQHILRELTEAAERWAATGRPVGAPHLLRPTPRPLCREKRYREPLPPSRLPFAA